jgi:hypothetical protein
MNNVSARQPSISARLARHASGSMSGGGVGGRTNAPRPRQMPAVSPTKATPLSAL